MALTGVSSLVSCPPGDKVRLGQGNNHVHVGIAQRTRSCVNLSGTRGGWSGVAHMLLGVGADSISLMGGGVDIIFETVVSFL